MQPHCGIANVCAFSVLMEVNMAGVIIMDVSLLVFLYAIVLGQSTLRFYQFPVCRSGTALGVHEVVCLSALNLRFAHG
jgi:hypothetical protein